MTDRPILFSAPMVRALFTCTKTQTRRLYAHGDHTLTMPLKPRHAVGDRLYVREHWRTESKAYDDLAPSDMGGEEPVIFAADADWSLNKTVGRPRQGMHMPRWASRLTLTVTDVSVQRLQDISEADAIAEGIVSTHPILEYQLLWDSLNADRAPWASNPWVTATSFTVERRNIDEVR